MTPALRLVLCLPPVLGSCLEASSETGSTACSLTVGRLRPSALYFTAFPSGHPLLQAHRSVLHQLSYFLAAKYADSCLLANIRTDSSGNCVLDLHEVLPAGRNNSSSSSEALLTHQTLPLCCSTSANPLRPSPGHLPPLFVSGQQRTQTVTALCGVLPLPPACVTHRG